MNAGDRRNARELFAAAGIAAEADAPALNEDIEALVCDSRKAGPGSLFVALPGSATAGHLYIADAVERGCRAVAVDAALIESGQIAPEHLLFCIPVDDARRALHALAGAWFGRPAERMRFVGVTGTNGKTTSTWLIEGILLQAGFRPGVIGTVNYRYHGADGVHILQNAPLTTPDPLTLQALFRQMADAGVTHVIMELSSHALDQGRVGDLRFDAAAFTNLTRDHLDYHRDMASYFAAKSLLFTKHLKPGAIAVIDTDAPGEEEPWGERLAAIAREAGHSVLTTGLAEGCDARGLAPKFGFDGFTCALVACGARAKLHSPLVGAYNARNVLGAVGVGLALGLPLETVLAGIAAVRAVPGRLERVAPCGNAALFPAVFVDYAHTPDALENVLKTLVEVRGKAAGRIVTVFGCGGDRDPGKRPLMGGVAAKYSDIVVVTSDNPRTEEPEAIIDAILPGLEAAGMAQVAPEALFAEGGRRFARIADRGRAIDLACGLAEPGDIVLIAGKGHEDYQILGCEKRYFDDRVRALDALAAWNARLLLAATGGVQAGAASEKRLLGRVCTDSRALQAGDIFVALKGERFDGHDFIEQAIAAGAGAIIAERFPENLPQQGATLRLEVPDSFAALGALAHFRRALFADRVKVAAVTGSSGKTTVKEILAAICETALKDDWAHPEPVLKTGGNFNNLIGLPLSLLPLNAGHRAVVLEMGMSAPGEIATLTQIADPDAGCVSTVHPAHLQGLGSIEGVARAKGELYRTMRPEAVRVVNEDDPRIWRIAEECTGPNGAKVGFAVTEEGRARNPLVTATAIENRGERGLAFTLQVGDRSRRIELAAIGEHNVHNAAAAAALAHAVGIAPEAIAAGLEAYRPGVDKRLAVRDLPGGLKLINDVYNANPASMAAGLRTVAALARNDAGSGKTLAVLGDMLELGETSADLHRGIGELVAELKLNLLAVTGEHAPDVASGAMAKGMSLDQIRVFENPAAIGPWCAALVRQGALGRGDWIFVKGSRGMRMEGFIEALERELGATDAKNTGGGHAL